VICASHWIITGIGRVPIIWVGIVLIILGGLVLAYQGINYRSQKNIVDVGSVHITADTHEQIPFLPFWEDWPWLEESFCWSWGRVKNHSRESRLTTGSLRN
jgi:hypothetical protein